MYQAWVWTALSSLAATAVVSAAPTGATGPTQPAQALEVTAAAQGQALLTGVLTSATDDPLADQKVKVYA